MLLFLGTIILLAALLIHFSLFSGKLIREVEGKVHSIYYKKFTGYRSHTNVQMAKVKMSNDEKIDVICQSYCTIVLKVNVNVYRPLIGSEVIYIYEREQ